MSCHKCGYFEGHDEDCQTVVALDHGSSAADLREKVEALEKRCDGLASQDVLNYGDLMTRLDAALRRIEQLEQQQARNDLVYRVPAIPIDPEHERIVEEAIRNARPSAPIDKEDV